MIYASWWIHGYHNRSLDDICAQYLGSRLDHPRNNYWMGRSDKRYLVNSFPTISFSVPFMASAKESFHGYNDSSRDGAYLCLFWILCVNQTFTAKNPYQMVRIFYSSVITLLSFL